MNKSTFFTGQPILNQLIKYLPKSKINLVIKVFLIDSTTITLFTEILKAAGRPPSDGRRKGGVKVHMMVKAEEDVPALVRITSAATNDTNFFRAIQLAKGSYA